MGIKKVESKFNLIGEIVEVWSFEYTVKTVIESPGALIFNP
jgi:hypothetical protein